MSRIGATFARLRATGRKGLIPYVPVGYPDADATPGLVAAFVRGGADLVELGVPFSDPIADGATIQKATTQALQNGVTVQRCLEAAAAARRRVDVPLLFMGYYNPIFAYGPARFVREAAAAGIDGLIVPDLPPDEAAELDEPAKAAGIDSVYLVAPTSTRERVEAVCRASRGFVYCVSLTGVTGARTTLRSDLKEFLARVRRCTDLPLAVGFGIGRPEQFAAVAELADGVIVGSALVDRLARLAPAEREAGATEFLRWLRSESRVLSPE